MPLEERKIYHWASLLWFTSSDMCADTMITNQRNIVVDYVGMLFLFPRSVYHSPWLVTS